MFNNYGVWFLPDNPGKDIDHGNRPLIAGALYHILYIFMYYTFLNYMLISVIGSGHVSGRTDLHLQPAPVR